MKRIIICYLCKKPKRESESYKVKVESWLQEEPFTALIESEGRVKVCRSCIKKIGYKVKKGITRIPLDNHNK